MNQQYNEFKERLVKIADIGHSAAVLQWDQEVYMPPAGAGFRAQQIASLSGIAHELAVDEAFGKLLKVLSEDSSLSDKEVRNVADTLKDYERQQKLSTEFVETLSKTTSEAFHAWQKAKKENNFSLFAPLLEKLVDLKKQECELVGYEGHPYDALIDEYEPNTKTADIDTLFTEVREKLVGFVKTIAEAQQNDDSFMFKQYDKDQQWEYGLHLLKQMGYDFDAGRQDISPHPFTINFSSKDVRVTTRVNENNINEMMWSCIHEGGHALYEQGLPEKDYGLPTGTYISLGIHESQSRLWENNVGRALPYWKANYGKLQETFPGQLGDVSVDGFYKAMNVVKPSLIRTAADELTYHFHILIRFEIEKALIEGSISVNELPEYWNGKYKEYLDVDVPSDDQGVLQDIHWSHGSFGYFPTYSLGSFYAAQFYAKALQDVEGLEKEIETGNMKPLLEWLRNNIHCHGRLYTAEELCENVTGEKLNFNYFMEYATQKYSELYGLKIND